MISAEIKALVDELNERQVRERDVLEDLAINLNRHFASDNPEFHSDRFMKACGF